MFQLNGYSDEVLETAHFYFHFDSKGQLIEKRLSEFDRVDWSPPLLSIN